MIRSWIYIKSLAERRDTHMERRDVHDGHGKGKQAICAT